MSLPSGYKRLAYIQSSGTQWVDTEFVPNSNTRIVAEIATTTTAPSSNKWVFGSRSASATQRYEIIYIASASAFRFYLNTSNYTFSGVSLGRLSIDVSASSATINGVKVTPSVSSFTGAGNLYIFSCNSSSVSSEAITQKVYRFKIYDNGTLVRDFVPCLNPSGVAGLYDLANGKFYGNAGTGTFAAGELTFLEYIQSSGTQYVDTGFKPNQDTRVVMDCDIISTTSTYTPFGVWDANGSNQFAAVATSSIASRIYCGSVYKNGTISILGKHTIDMNKNILYVDGQEDVSVTAATFQCSYPLFLCTWNNAGTPRDNNWTSLKIYSCLIYDNGTLVRNFRPAQAGEEVGLWDALNEVFYPNAGTGTFAAGPVASADTPENFEQVLAVFLRWSSVDCEGYNIYRDGVLFDTTTDTYYIDLTADENEQYTYTLTAFNGSAESDPATLEVYTRSGYFVLKPVIESAFFQ